MLAVGNLLRFKINKIMINSPVLDTAIGLVFIFLLYSLLATSINEAIATLLSLRARMLKRGIIDGMLSDTKKEKWIWLSTFKNWFESIKELGSLIIGYKPITENKLGDKIYNHPIIKNYGSNDRFSIPSYIPKENFSTILIEVLEDYWNSHKENISLFIKKIDIPKNIDLENLPRITKIHYLVKYLQSEDFKKLKEEPDSKNDKFHIDKETLEILTLFLDKSYQNIETFTAQLETWYDDSMNRISGWYKRQIQFILFFIGLTVAITFNVDIIDIAGKLSTDKDARDKLVEMAIKEADKLKDDPRVKPLKDKLVEFEKKEIKKDTIEKTAKFLKEKEEYIENKKDYDKIISQYNGQLDSIKKDLNGRIKEANNLLAIGWGDYGLKQDSLTYINRYNKCFKCFRNTIKKTDSVKFYKTQALLNQYSNDSSSIGKKKLEEIKKTFKQDSIFYKDTLKLNQRTFIELYKSKEYRIKARYVLSNFHKGRKPLGFLLLAFGICLGAPFWFDLLQKLIKIRGSGKKEETGDGNTTSTATPTSTPVQVTINNTNPEAIG